VVGFINSITAVAGERERLMQLLTQSSVNIPGCISYIIGADSAHNDRIWITEVWDSAKSTTCL
jgi:quinol monooxygenase YgiN